MRSSRFHIHHGFTLLEVMMAIGILTIIFGAGLPTSIGLLRNYVLDADRDTLVTLLQRAQNEAFANLNQASHGVEITATSFVGYQGSSYASRDTTKDIVFPRSKLVTTAGDVEVNFSAIKAQVAAGKTITLNNTIKTETVTVNPEGMIDW